MIAPMIAGELPELRRAVFFHLRARGHERLEGLVANPRGAHSVEQDAHLNTLLLFSQQRHQHFVAELAALHRAHATARCGRLRVSRPRPAPRMGKACARRSEIGRP